METTFPPKMIPTLSDWMMEVKFQNFLFKHRKNVKNETTNQLNKMKK